MCLSYDEGRLVVSCLHISVGSALLILDQRQCEGPVCGISEKYRSRVFYVLWFAFEFQEKPSGSGAAGIKSDS